MLVSHYPLAIKVINSDQTHVVVFLYHNKISTTHLEYACVEDFHLFPFV